MTVLRTAGARNFAGRPGLLSHPAASRSLTRVNALRRGATGRRAAPPAACGETHQGHHLALSRVRGDRRPVDHAGRAAHDDELDPGVTERSEERRKISRAGMSRHRGSWRGPEPSSMRSAADPTATAGARARRAHDRPRRWRRGPRGREPRRGQRRSALPTSTTHPLGVPRALACRESNTGAGNVLAPRGGRASVGRAVEGRPGMGYRGSSHLRMALTSSPGAPALSRM